MAAPASSPIASAPIPNPNSSQSFIHKLEQVLDNFSYSVDSLFPEDNPDHASGAGGYDDHPNSIYTDAPEDGGGGGYGIGYGSSAPSSAAQPLPDNVRKEIPELGFSDDVYNYKKLLNLPPPQHKVYPSNLFEDKEVGAFLMKQQHGKLKLEEWEDPEDSESSEDSESDLPPLLLHKKWLRQSFRDLPPPLSDGRQALVNREEELKGRKMLKLKEVTSSLTTQMTEKTNVSEVIDTMKQLVKDAKLADVEVVQMLWEIVLEQARKASEVIRQVKENLGELEDVVLVESDDEATVYEGIVETWEKH